jgi:GNAT superfamily N-acetyltransferase
MHLLDNIFWNSLNGSQAHLAIGTGEIRRYAPGFCPIAGFEKTGIPDFAALADVCERGERLYCDGWFGSVPHGWNINEERSTFRMVWEGPIPANDQAPDAVKLGPEHVAVAQELANVTESLPFGERSIELGDYFGYFKHGKLVAMAGERLAAEGFREISGICTLPDVIALGMTRRLVAKLARRQLMRGETPFLHVREDRSAEHQLYKRMGFRDHCLSRMRIISRWV